MNLQTSSQLGRTVPADTEAGSISTAMFLDGKVRRAGRKAHQDEPVRTPGTRKISRPLFPSSSARMAGGSTARCSAPMVAWYDQSKLARPMLPNKPPAYAQDR